MVYEGSHQARIRGITGVSLVAASAGVVFRLVSRRLKGQQLFLDDWILIVALVMSVMVCYEQRLMVDSCLNGVLQSRNFFVRLNPTSRSSSILAYLRKFSKADSVNIRARLRVLIWSYI